MVRVGSAIKVQLNVLKDPAMSRAASTPEAVLEAVLETAEELAVILGRALPLGRELAFSMSLASYCCQ